MTSPLSAREPATAFADGSAAEVRINARLDADHAEKLRRLMARRGCGITDAIKFAIECGYAETEGSKASGKKRLDALIGAFDGRPDAPEDLSENYKAYLDLSLGLKYRAAQESNPSGPANGDCR